MFTRRFASPWLLVLFFVPAQPAVATVIQGPEEFRGNTYLLLENATWTESEQEAISLGGHLVTVNDAAENEWLRQTFIVDPGRTIGLWLGLTDQDVEGTFVWTSGEPFVYENWFPGEPNNFPFNDPINGEDYGMMFGSGFWNDTDDLGQDQAPLHGVVEIGSGVVPEPATGPLTLCGLLLLAGARRARSPRSAR